MRRWSQSSKMQKQTVAQIVFDWIEDIAVAIALVTVFFTFFIRVVTVDGSSMTPNYSDGDRVLISEGVSQLKKGDVVIISDINFQAGSIIKRVVAVEGQTVDFDSESKCVLIDSIPLDDKKYGIQDGVTKLAWSNYEMLEFPAVVPEGHVFVLGDNREISIDSRYKDIGMVDKRNILGKSVFKIYPFEDFGKVN